jgi:hypothetical protein
MHVTAHDIAIRNYVEADRRFAADQKGTLSYVLKVGKIQFFVLLLCLSLQSS